MPPTIRLPRADGALEPYTLREPVAWTAPAGPIQSRVAYAAAHVVCDALADCDPLSQPRLAYEEQVGYVERHGGRVILMASRALTRAARGPDDYRRVYETILRQASRPVILHWLGDMFDPELAGYWGTRHVRAAMHVCLGIIREHRTKVDGIKISLLDEEREIEMRALLPDGVRMYTGDDLNYDRLILGDGGAGDGHRHSDALLGIFDAIAPAASAALQALDRGDVAGYRRALAPSVPLSRHIFQPPTYAYKTGVVFLAYLNGHQTHFRMLGGAESWRSMPHLAELFRLANCAGLLVDPERAAERMRRGRGGCRGGGGRGGGPPPQTPPPAPGR